MSRETLRLHIARKHTEAPGICSLELVPLQGATLPPFTAGAHIELHLPAGLRRAYSLLNAPHERHRYRIAVLRTADSRGGSVAVHDHLREGDVLEVGAPLNAFALAPAGTRHVLVAGGIGITPLLSMAEQLHADRADFELIYHVRSRQQAAFIAHLAKVPWAGRVSIHADDEAPRPAGIDAAKAWCTAPQPGTHLYVCGPAGFMEAVLGRARAEGWAAGQLHWEAFTAGASANAQGEQPFELVLARSGRLVTVPADCTAAQALIASGVDVPLSCEQGICGTCLTPVLSGRIDHRDCFLTPDEQARGNQFTPCCSRATGHQLVIDL